MTKVTLPDSTEVIVSVQEGYILKGGIQRWDGNAWGTFPALKGHLISFQELGDGHIYLCSSEGYGAFHAKSGKEVYWKDDTCPVFFQGKWKPGIF